MKRRRFFSTCIGGIAAAAGACLGIKGQPDHSCPSGCDCCGGTPNEIEVVITGVEEGDQIWCVWDGSRYRAVLPDGTEATLVGTDAELWIQHEGYRRELAVWYGLRAKEAVG